MACRFRSSRNRRATTDQFLIFCDWRHTMSHQTLILEPDVSEPDVSDSLTALDFTLPLESEASAPPEARGRARDEVRLMVSFRVDNGIVHASFRDIEDFLRAGDVLAI